MDQIGGILQQYAGGGRASSREEARAHYDQISTSVPRDLLGSVIGPAMSSLPDNEIQERIYNSATEMTPQQRGGFLQNLLGGLSAGGTNIGDLLGRLGINKQVAEQPEVASPEDVAKLATHAQQTNPSLFERAMSFYAEHPGLVKVLGSVAIAAIARKLSERGGSAAGTAGGLLGGLGV